jgi:hypothetical protein
MVLIFVVLFLITVIFIAQLLAAPAGPRNQFTAADTG